MTSPLSHPYSANTAGNVPEQSIPIVMPSYPEPQELIVYSLHEFLQLKLPERGYLIYPILPEQGLVLLYAPRGVGKTQLAIIIGLTASFGLSIFNWRCDQKYGVLFIDGEMQAYALQERLASFAVGAGIKSEESLFRLITPDSQPQPLPNLAKPMGQAAIEPHLKDISLVILDNLASLCSAGKENETESWVPVQRWLLDLRRRGLSVLVVHHAGKNGDQRGTSAREDLMDTVIALKRPADYRPEEGARFEVHITKARGVTGAAVAPFEAHLRQEGNAYVWSHKEIRNPQVEEVCRLAAEGLSVRKIAEKSGLTKSTVHRMLQNAVPDYDEM